MEKIHYSVLLDEVIQVLDLTAKDSFIDCTFGAGGHTAAALKKIGPSGKVLGLERDKEILEQVEKKWSNKKNVKIVNQRFSGLKKVVKEENFGQADAILLDLGVSSWQLDRAKRGFSYRETGDLDMRMGISDMTAAEFLNQASVTELKYVFDNYGEIRNSGNIAKKIIESREKKSIKTSIDFLDILSQLKITKDSSRNLLARIWQAIRMKINNEEEELKSVLPQAVEILKPKGRLAVISFHSGEDRIVKDFFKENSRSCICPSDFPVCVCKIKPILKVITKKAIKPTEKEISINSRSSSAKLRAAMKI